MAALLALLSAAAYGSGDFLGGLAARRLPAAAVTLRTAVIGWFGLAVVTLLVPAERVVGADLAWGAVGGVAGAVGILALYSGLAQGPMSVVAPITAVLSAVVPVLFGLVSGERPSWVAGGGIVAALVAIALVSRVDDPDGDSPPVDARLIGVSLAAGLGFGVFFIGLDLAGDDAGLWPIMSARTATVICFAALAMVWAGARVGDRRARERSTAWLLVGTGILDTAANALFLLATQRGLLTLVAVLGALYPAATVVLARVVLGERMSRTQLAGCGVAVVAVVAVSGG